MGHHLRALQRLSILLLVWFLAGGLCVRAYTAWQANREMRLRMDANQADYDSKLAELTKLLENKQRLDSDTETQVNLLKQKLGYCEPGEIPIIIVDRSGSNS
ncbi:hypothetical protein KDL44_08885 [bacterium]|nr:hypothetical protein [bacterium]